MLNSVTNCFLCCDNPFDRADTVLFGAPFDGTVSYRPGARFGPQAIRNESWGIESYSPVLDKDLQDIRVCDGGDLDLPFGDVPAALDAIEAQTEEILQAGKLPLLLGGEHLVTLPAVKAAARQYPDLHIIHFDAHADLRQDYLGVGLSHACVLRRCWEILGDGRIFQFAIRSGDREEFRFARAGHTRMQTQDFQGLDEVLRHLQGKPVYFTCDLDVLDPAVFPGTGTPEAGGVSFPQLAQAVYQVAAGAQVVAADITELSPPYDSGGISVMAACKLLRELLLALHCHQ
ncbi:MAG: agmatinase [Firmicutes bacterium]|nr:agmatinase [Bacillota bacterium]